MPVTPSYPGLYIEELPLSAHSISAAPTSITVIVGYTHPFKTKRFNEEAAKLSGVDIYTVSMDLPFAQLRWRTTESVSHGALSSHRSEAFGKAYGVLLKEWRLLERAVFVIDGTGRLTHVEYVPDQLAEPDYDAALEAARSAAGRAS